MHASTQGIKPEVELYKLYLLQQHRVVALKGLEDVMVAAPRPKAIHCCVPMTATALTADGQRVGCVASSVRFQACSTQYTVWQLCV